MPSAEYHKLSGYNWSRIKHALDSGKHYLYAQAVPFGGSDATRLGTAVHTLILEPENADSVIVCPSSLASDATGKMLANKSVQAWLAEEPARAEAITPQQWDAAQRMRDAVMSHTAAADLLRICTRREVILQWQADGKPRKGSVDAFGGGVLLDLKSDGEWGETTPHSFIGKADKLHYYGALGNYSEGLIATGETVDEMGWIVVSSKQPHNVMVIMLDRSGIAHARDEASEAWRRVLAWEASGVYPSAHPRTVYVGAPKWCSWKGQENPIVEEVDNGF